MTGESGEASGLIASALAVVELSAMVSKAVARPSLKAVVLVQRLIRSSNCKDSGAPVAIASSYSRKLLVKSSSNIHSLYQLY